MTDLSNADRCPDCGHAVTVADPCRCDYETWLKRQFVWLREKVGAEEGEPLAIAVEALHRIACMAVNADGTAKYWVARSALEKIGAWKREDSDD